MGIYAERIERLRGILRDRRLVGAVFGPTDQMRYVSGWAEPGHERLIALFVPASGDPAFLVPAMNAPQAKRNPAGIVQVRAWEDQRGWSRPAEDLLRSWPEGCIAIDDELHSAHLLQLQSILPGCRFEAAGQLLADLRIVKAADEISLMERSAAITDAVYEECLQHVREGMSELDLAETIRRAYAARGTAPAFCLVCFGENSALPHHHTGGRRLNRGDVAIVDIGCHWEGYASDITRTFAFGEAEPEADRVYAVVLRAYRAAFDAARPGATCEAVDAAARGVIEVEGYGERFIHRTGHGIGLSTHEPPYIVAGNAQRLEAGMCFSDEPGIYLEGRFGVRIENILTVEGSGCRSLNAAPPDRLPVIRA